MENITLGQIAAFISFSSIFIGAIISLITFSKKMIQKILTPLNQKIEHLEQVSLESRNSIELEFLKMSLTNFINDLEQGIEKNQVQKENACQLYDRYVSLKGNSYIHEEWEKLKKEGKI